MAVRPPSRGRDEHRGPPPLLSFSAADLFLVLVYRGSEDPSLSLSRSCTFPSRFDSIADSIEASRPRFPRLPPSPHLQGMSRTRKTGLAAQRCILCALDRIEILS
ncbi:hypothetical protein B296_00021168 [Ensete ventricosum]|uniref:Uncharacterized protein n=1 Tax=Ensete ventricosum TaxID=4639 RepID=A0A426ZI87_ENSVE|nr:hypothetical protein B296_00021168 [Ensete ventricosum]